MVANNINDKVEINKRLLKSFSVNALKEVFNLIDNKERQDGILNLISASNSETNIYNEIFNNFSLLKQHIFIYEFKGVFNENWLDKHPNFVNKNLASKSLSFFNLLIPIKYEGFNKTTNKIDEIDFLIPVQITRRKTILSFHINILERDIKSLTTDNIVGASRNISDVNILDDIIKFANPIQLYKYDLNKGIKYLWENDEIDALKVKFKNSKSISEEIMDGQNLVKKEYPAKYLELIKQPLHRTTFKVIKEKNLVNYFIVDPTFGTLNFNVFPQHLNGINDLIDLVLINN